MNAQLVRESGVEDYLAVRYAVVGTSDECRSRLEQLRNWGISKIWLNTTMATKSNLWSSGITQLAPSSDSPSFRVQREHRTNLRYSECKRTKKSLSPDRLDVYKHRGYEPIRHRYRTFVGSIGIEATIRRRQAFNKFHELPKQDNLMSPKLPPRSSCHSRLSFRRSIFQSFWLT